MPLHHCRGSNYLQLSSFWSTVKIRCFSWFHSSAGNSGGISLLLFFLFRGKMRSLRVPHPCITTALSPYYPNPDLLQTPAKVSQTVGQPDGCTHTRDLLWKLHFCESGISTFWVDNKVVNAHYANCFWSQTEKLLHIMSSFLSIEILDLNHLYGSCTHLLTDFLLIISIYLSSSGCRNIFIITTNSIYCRYKSC